MEAKQAVIRAEEEIDAAFASSPLTHIDYAQAVWTLLSVNEDAFLKAIYTRSGEELHIFADNRLNALTYPLRVCLAKCKTGNGAVHHELIDEHYKLAWDWLEAAEDYTLFSTIFPLWHRARLDIAVVDKSLIVTDPPNANKDYEAYNRLFRKEAREEQPATSPDENLVNFLLSRTTVAADQFRVNFNPALVSGLVSFLSPHMATRHTLPADWQFNTFSLKEYRQVLLTLQSLAHGWHIARTVLAQNGMHGLGYKSSVWVVGKNELLARLKRYTGLDAAVIARIIDLITFGSNQIRNPDIAVQPLIDLRNGSLALDPFILLDISLERNLCVLLNQIPSEKETYSRLSNDKEATTKAEIEQFLAPYGFDFRSGRVEGTDVDLAIIDRVNKVCRCLELKWFIEPAEIREIEERSRELAQGISQAKKIKLLFERGDKRLIERLLEIDRHYAFLCAVGSVNWIGHGDVQDPEVPIIKVWHLLSRFKETGSLLELTNWLSNRDYLPKQGIDYTVKPWELSCGNWSATWYGIQPLSLAEIED